MNLPNLANKKLVTAIADSLAVAEVTLAWLAGDGSDRQYYRIFVNNTDDSFVLMLLSKTDGLKLQTGDYEWILASNLLRESGIRAPSLVAPLIEHNALIIEDYGDEMLQDIVNTALAKGDQNLPNRLYLEAIDLAISIHAQKRSLGPFWTKRSFNYDKYIWELEFFYKQYYEQVSRNKLPTSDESLLKQEFNSLAHYLAPLSTFCVHRDYHSRNLMVHNDSLAVIDFQDLRLGPIAYDVVSLVFDSYVHLPLSKRLELISVASNRISEALGKVAGDEFDSTWKSVLLQRQIKAIGSFGYLTIEKQRGNYLKYVKTAVSLLGSIQPLDQRWPILSGPLLEVIESNAT